MNPYIRIMLATVYRPGDYIDWAAFLELGIKPRIRVKMGRA